MSAEPEPEATNPDAKRAEPEAAKRAEPEPAKSAPDAKSAEPEAAKSAEPEPAKSAEPDANRAEPEAAKSAKLPAATPGEDAALDLTGDAPVPKIPRGRGLKLSGGQMLRIALTAAMLVMLILMTKPCSNAVSSFVTNFGSDGSAADTMPKPGALGMPRPSVGSAADYEHISNMTDDERKAAIERSRAKAAAARAAEGSGSNGSAAGSNAAPVPTP